MKRNYTTLLGILLVVAGVLLGLQQYGYLRGEWSDAVFTGLWALGALYLFDIYRQDRGQWWFGLAAFVLAGLAVASGLALFFPQLGGALGGFIFLGAIGAGFLIAYRRNPGNWWALIPAGVMISLALISVVDDLPIELPFESGSLLFFGMGLTFLALSQLRVGEERLTWAVYPAIPLLVLGFFVGFGEAASWNYIWPSLIILLGVYFLVDAVRRR
jgi:hypothetical protein